MIDRTYLFNPYLLQTCDDEKLSNVINELSNAYRNSDIPTDVAFNINLESDLLMIYGEFIARLTEESSLKKLECDNEEATYMYKLRKQWNEENDGKVPSIDYFKAQASELIKDKRERQLKLEAMLTRFKKAYSSLETKQNALKKKLDAMKYEEI